MLAMEWMGSRERAGVGKRTRSRCIAKRYAGQSASAMAIATKRYNTFLEPGLASNARFGDYIYIYIYLYGYLFSFNI